LKKVRFKLGTKSRAIWENIDFFRSDTDYGGCFGNGIVKTGLVPPAGRYGVEWSKLENLFSDNDVYYFIHNPDNNCLADSLFQTMMC